MKRDSCPSVLGFRMPLDNPNSYVAELFNISSNNMDLVWDLDAKSLKRQSGPMLPEADFIAYVMGRHEIPHNNNAIDIVSPLWVQVGKQESQNKSNGLLIDANVSNSAGVAVLGQAVYFLGFSAGYHPTIQVSLIRYVTEMTILDQFEESALVGDSVLTKDESASTLFYSRENVIVSAKVYGDNSITLRNITQVDDVFQLMFVP